MSRTFQSRTVTHFAIGPHALVVTKPLVTIGDATNRRSDIPVDGVNSNESTYILRHPDCYQVVQEQKGLATKVVRRLESGDSIFVPTQTGLSIWRFSLPVPGSWTAMLETRNLDVRTPFGGDFRRVILMDQRIEIRPHGACHLSISSLPCEVLLLQLTASGLTCATEGGKVSLENGTPLLEDVPVPIGGVIVVDAEEDMRVGVLRLLAGIPHEPMRIRFVDCFTSQRF